MTIDPLGATVGITALTLEVAEDIIKVYKYYKQAINLPQTYNYLRIRLDIEHQRYLHFCLEAGILYESGTLCASLQVNRSLLLSALAEIKALLSDYAKKKGKYRTYSEYDHVNWNDQREPDPGALDFVFRPADKGESHAKKGIPEEPSKTGSLRAFGKLISRTGSNLKTIAMEPKRLVWVTLDKDSFEALLAKMENLNSFLIALLDSSSIRRTQETVETSYLEILQMRNDIESLISLVQALGSSRESNDSTSEAFTSSLFEAVEEETQAELRTKNYLKQLAEIKIQYYAMEHTDGKGSISDFKATVRSSLDPLDFGRRDLEWDATERRTEGKYRGSGIWLEWKDCRTDMAPVQGLGTLEHRIALLTNLLCYEKPAGFRAPECLGYVKCSDEDEDDEDDNSAYYGIVFRKPSISDEDLQLFTLKILLQKKAKPSLSSRLRLCAVLASSVSNFHAVSWLHKSIRGDNILFFATSPKNVDIGSPFLAGFELSRPSIIDEMSEKPTFIPQQEIYRHPDAQYGSAKKTFRKSYDMYSLGVLLVEIAYWKPIEEVIGVRDLQNARPFQLHAVQSKLLGRKFDGNATVPAPPPGDVLCLDKIASKCGNGFRNVVESCLTMHDEEKLAYPGELESSVAIRLQASTQAIVKTLEQLSHAVQ